MLTKYKFLDREKIEINASDKVGECILQIENEIKNNNRRETRRHQSLNKVLEKTICSLMKTSILKKNF